MVDTIMVVIAVIVIVGYTLGAFLLYAKYYVRVPPGKVLVVFGATRNRSARGGYQFFIRGGKFVVPIYEDHGFMPLEIFTSKVELKDVVTKDRNHLSLTVFADHKLRSDEEGLTHAAENFFRKDVEVMKNAVEAKVALSAVDIFSGYDLENIVSHRSEISKAWKAQVHEALWTMGIELKSLAIHEMHEHGVVVSDMKTMKAHLKDLRSELAELEGKLAAVEKAGAK